MKICCASRWLCATLGTCLPADPRELQNRWDDPAYAGVKTELLLRFVQAEIEREPTRMPRIAVQGYNTKADLEVLLNVLKKLLQEFAK
jgi:hypothetical protein